MRMEEDCGKIYQKFSKIQPVTSGISNSRCQNKISKIDFRSVLDIVKSFVDDACIINCVFKFIPIWGGKLSGLYFEWTSNF